ncbi:shikimate dehydrogenase [Pontixanthobacter gangjinensis]|uniref:Shikimate dehydrogenase (NADP(+)) n=1 Tax=Pontixanthobacter gangjinensis TaxID=1028742 RepID=A0A6I4SIP6_9SPHN|nr:shikimate dehydrogenase [Pontixanthobacter gangjinensis]MXO55711.1 shikimate dehydrogenase [Pontixanthobacter gangjinensis]
MSPDERLEGVKYAEVIGDPIVQSKSPLIHNFWLREAGIEAMYQHQAVSSEGLADFLMRRRKSPLWLGCNVTMPHKQAIISLLDTLDPLAEKVGAVNTVIRQQDGSLKGYNTDVAGFLEPLRSTLSNNHLFRMARILGTGGAARAIVTALQGEGMVLVVAGRRIDRAEALLSELTHANDHHAVPISHFAQPTDFEFDDRDGCLDLVVNTTPLGMRGQMPLAFDFSHAPPGSIIYDIVTDPVETEFLKSAQQAGFETVDGLTMLVGQAAAAYELFFGAAPPRGRDAELRQRLIA